MYNREVGNISKKEAWQERGRKRGLLPSKELLQFLGKSKLKKTKQFLSGKDSSTEYKLLTLNRHPYRDKSLGLKIVKLDKKTQENCDYKLSNRGKYWLKFETLTQNL